MMGWYNSALTSVVSACVAVLVTLQYRSYIPPAALDNLPASSITGSTPTKGTSRERDSQRLTAGTAVDLAQALGLGRVLLAKGEPEEAALAFRIAANAAVSITGDTIAHDVQVSAAEAYHGLGLALRAAGRVNEALSACQEAERLGPSLAAASICVGALLTEAGDTAEALTVLRRAAELESDGEGEASSMLGAALVAAGEVEEAIPVLTRALAMDKMDVHSAYNLGVAWQNKGETDKAVAAYAKAVELAPGMTPARVNLGAQLLQSGRLQDAEAMLLIAIDLEDDAASRAAAYANLGAVLEKTGRSEQALESYSEAEKLGAGRISLLHMAKLYQDLGQPEKALETSQRALETGGGDLDPSALLQAGLLLESLGRIDEAVDFFARAMQEDAQSLEATMHLGHCQSHLGRHHEALESFLKVSRLDPGNAEVYNLLHRAVSDAQLAGGRAESDSAFPDNLNGPLVTRHEPGRRPITAGKQGSVDEPVPPKAATVDGKQSPPDSVPTIASSELGNAEKEKKKDKRVKGRGGEKAEDINLLSSDTGTGRGSEGLQDAAADKRSDGIFDTEGEREDDPTAAWSRKRGSASVHPASMHESDLVWQDLVDEPREQLPVVGATALDSSLGEENQQSLLMRDDAHGAIVAELFAESAERGSTVADEVGPDFAKISKNTKPVESLTSASEREPQHKASLEAEGHSVVREVEVYRDARQSTTPEATAAPENIFDASLLSETNVPKQAVENTQSTAEFADRAGKLDPSSSDVGVVRMGRDEVGSAGEGSGAIDGDALRDSKEIPWSSVLDDSATTLNAGASDKAYVGNSAAGEDGDDKTAPATDLKYVKVSGNETTNLSGDAEKRVNEISSSSRPDGTSATNVDVAGNGIASGGIETAVDHGEQTTPAASSKQGEGKDEKTTASSAEGEILSLSAPDDNIAARLDEGNGKADGGIVAPGAETSDQTVSTAVLKEEEDKARETATSLPENAYEGVVRDLSFLAPDATRGTYADGGEKDKSSGSTTASGGTSGLDQTVPAVGPSDDANNDKESTAGTSENNSDVAKMLAEEPSDVLDLAPLVKDDPAGSDAAIATEAVDENARESEREESKEGGDVAEILDAGSAEEVAATKGEGAPPAGVDHEVPARQTLTGDVVEGDKQGEVKEAGQGVGVNATAGDGAGGAEGDSGDEEREIVARESVDAAAVEPQIVEVTEEDAKRAMSKVKLGLVHLQQGKVRKAAALFDKASSVDPGWWEGFYYSAVARDTLGEAEAAADALVSALKLPAATETGENSQIAGLASKILASLEGHKGENAATRATELKAAVAAAGLDIALAPPRANSLDSASQDTRDPLEDISAPTAQGVGRTASMGGGRPDGTLETDLANLEKAKVGSGAQEQGGSGVGEGGRWPFGKGSAGRSGRGGESGGGTGTGGGVGFGGRGGQPPSVRSDSPEGAGKGPGTSPGTSPGKTRGQIPRTMTGSQGSGGSGDASPPAANAARQAFSRGASHDDDHGNKQQHTGRRMPTAGGGGDGVGRTDSSSLRDGGGTGPGGAAGGQGRDGVGGMRDAEAGRDVPPRKREGGGKVGWGGGGRRRGPRSAHEQSAGAMTGRGEYGHPVGGDPKTRAQDIISSMHLDRDISLATLGAGGGELGEPTDGKKKDENGREGNAGREGGGWGIGKGLGRLFRGKPKGQPGK